MIKNIDVLIDLPAFYAGKAAWVRWRKGLEKDDPEIPAIADAIAILFELWNFPSLRSEPPRPLTGPPLLSQGGDKTSTVHCFFPSLSKEGWREAPGWFEAAIPQLRSDPYI